MWQNVIQINQRRESERESEREREREIDEGQQRARHIQHGDYQIQRLARDCRKYIYCVMSWWVNTSIAIELSRPKL